MPRLPDCTRRFTVCVLLSSWSVLWAIQPGGALQSAGGAKDVWRIAAPTILVIQALVIAGLLVERRRGRARAEAVSRAETANRARSGFLAKMSHELSTPAGAIFGFSRFLKSASGISEAERKTVDVIIRSSEHLLR